MDDLDISYDKALNIHTTGRDDSIADLVKFPYEPTPYLVLERIVSSGYIRKNNLLIDYGAGKGRVGLFISSETKCHSIGIEYNERLYKKAISNKNDGNFRRSEFILGNAEEFKFPDNADRCYFFNPFNLDTLKIVINNIRDSYIKNKREILLFFYYPSNKYKEYLDSNFKLIEEIDCSDLFFNDGREKILIYKFN